MAGLLLSHQAKVNIKDYKGNTPLHLCCFTGHLDPAYVLIGVHWIIHCFNVISCIVLWHNKLIFWIAFRLCVKTSLHTTPYKNVFRLQGYPLSYTVDAVFATRRNLFNCQILSTKIKKRKICNYPPSIEPETWNLYHPFYTPTLPGWSPKFPQNLIISIKTWLS